MTFFDNLERFKERTSMYITGNTLPEVTSFICGMEMMTDEDGLDSFRDWLCSEKLRIKSPCSWPVEISIYLNEQGVAPEDQVEAFFEILDEFLEKEKTVA